MEREILSDWHEQLRRAGIAQHWITVAEVIGPDAFMVMLSVLHDSGALDDRNRVHIPSVRHIQRRQRADFMLTVEELSGDRKLAASMASELMGGSRYHMGTSRFWRHLHGVSTKEEVSE